VTRYAVSLCDLLTVGRRDPIVKMVLSPHIDSEQTVSAENRKVAGIGYAVVLTCSDEQAEAMIEVMRMKYKRYQLRFYSSATGNGNWKRV